MDQNEEEITKRFNAVVAQLSGKSQNMVDALPTENLIYASTVP